MGEACPHSNKTLKIQNKKADTVEISTPTEPTTLPWFALKVRSRSEALAAAALQAKGYSPFAPMYATERQYCDRKKTIQRPLFPGYMFCRFDPGRKAPVLSCPAVECVVSFDGVPAVVPDEQIENVRKALKAGATPVPYLRIGHRVVVTRGPLTGVEGILVRIGSSDRVVISVDLLQRSIAVEVDRFCVKSA